MPGYQVGVVSTFGLSGINTPGNQNLLLKIWFQNVNVLKYLKRSVIDLIHKRLVTDITFTDKTLITLDLINI